MSENFRPLNDEDINRLDELLATSSSLDDTFDVSMLDGYLSAVALLNPAPEDESVWYPYIFNEAGTEVTIDEPENVNFSALAGNSSLSGQARVLQSDHLSA